MQHGEVIRIASIDCGRLQNQLVNNGGDYNNKVYYETKEDGTRKKREKKFTQKYNATMGNSLWLMHMNTMRDYEVIRREEKKVIDENGEEATRQIAFTDAVVQISFDEGYTEVATDKKGNEKKETKARIKKGSLEVKEQTKRKTVDKPSDLRDLFYNSELSIHDKKYVMDIRSSSMSRVGDCLFIKKSLHDEMEKWCRLGITLKPRYNIATVRAYESLAKSDIGDTITIQPDQILLIDDEKFEYATKASVTWIDENDKDDKGRPKLVTKTIDDYKGKSDIWDGQSLLDSRYFKYEFVYDKQGELIDTLPPKGAMLLRGKWFKTAAFSCNIQQWFKDNYTDDDGNPIKTVVDMFGNVLTVERIAMITTPNSMKILKMVDLSDQFNAPQSDDPSCQNNDPENIDPRTEKHDPRNACYQYWLNDLKSENGIFGVVKSESQSKLFDGTVQQMTYQTINSLPITREQFDELMQFDKDYVYTLRTDNNELFKHIARSSIDFNASLFQMFLKTHPDMIYTKEFKDQRRKHIEYYTDDLRWGRIKILDADYCWLFGNPIEMLWYSTRQCQEVDRDEVPHPLTGWQVYIKKYEDGKELAAFRNPHISSGNVCHLTNKHDADIKKYFNLTDNIAVINNIGTDIMPRMSGMDMDSDSANFIPDTTIVGIAKWCQEHCPTPICDIPVPPTTDEPTASKMAEIDNLISENRIGTICNRAQVFMSYWNDRRNNLLDRKEYDSKVASGEIVLTEEELINYRPVTPEDEKECEYYMDKHYDINSALSSLSQVEIDMPKKFINIDKLFERFIEEISDWKALGLYAPEIKYIRATTYTKTHKAIIDNNGWDMSKTEDKDKLHTILNLVEPLMSMSENDMTDEQRALRIKFNPFFTEQSKKVRPMFMGELNKKDKKTFNNFVYRVFNTPMDWVTPIVKGIDRGQRGKNGSTKRLVDLMTKGRKIKSGEHDKVKNICEIAKQYYDDYQAAKSKHRGWREARDIKDGFIIELQNFKMSSDTIYHIIRDVYEKEYEHRNFLLKSLCKARMADVVDCFRKIDVDNKGAKIKS